MNHPSEVQLMGLPENAPTSPEGHEIAAHVRRCDICQARVEGLAREAEILARVLAAPADASALKARLLNRERAMGTPSASAAPCARPGVALQLAAAILMLVAFGVMVSYPRERHHTLIAGRVRLPDGQTLSAPAWLPASRSWEVRAVEHSSFRAADGSTLDLAPESEALLGPQVRFLSGRARFAAAMGNGTAHVDVPGGWLRSSEGSVELETLLKGEHPMNKRLVTATVVTALSGYFAVGNAQAEMTCPAGEVVALSESAGPFRLSTPQAPQEALRRLETLTAQVEGLEKEIRDLEAENQTLKAKVASLAPAAPAGTGAKAGSSSAGASEERR